MTITKKFFERYPVVSIIGQTIAAILAIAVGRSITDLSQATSGVVFVIAGLAVFVAVIPTAIVKRVSLDTLLFMLATQAGAFFGVVYLLASSHLAH